MEFTYYEFNKHIKKLKSGSLNSSQIINNYIEKAYFLADAFAQKIDTLSLINKKVEYASITMLCQYKGYLWNIIEEPKLNFSNYELKATYKNQKKLFQIKYIFFPDTLTYLALLSLKEITDKPIDFETIKNIAHKNSLTEINRKLEYPFGRLYPVRDIIIKSSVGTSRIVGLSDGRILLYKIVSIEPKQLGEYNGEKIAQSLRGLKESQIIFEKQYRVRAQARITYYGRASETLIKNIRNSETLKHNSIIQNDTIASYYFNGKQIFLSSNQFLDYYLNNPFMVEIKNKNDFEKVIFNFVEEKYLYEESSRLGITDHRNFILDKRDFKNLLILTEYFKRNIPSYKPENDQIKSFYEENKNNFMLIDSFKIKVLKFYDINSAIQSFHYLNMDIKNISKGNLDSTLLRNVKSINSYIIDSLNILFDKDLMIKIREARNYTILGPYNRNNEYFLIIKLENLGYCFKPLSDVKNQIEKELIKVKNDSIRNHLLNEIKSKYSITINNLKE